MARSYIFESSKPERVKERERRERNERRQRTREKNRSERAKNADYQEKQEMKQQLRRVAKIVNSRAVRLRIYRSETGHNPPALEELENSGGNIRIPDTMPEIMREMLRAQNFLNDSTSTVRGAREFFRDIADIDDRWWIYNRLREIDPSIGTIRGRFSDVMEQIDSYITMQQYSRDEILKKMMNYISNYESESESIEEDIRMFE